MIDKRVSAIVPVFNEEKTIKKVVNTLLASKLISEIICINDGSTDRSVQILKEFGKKIKLINFNKNQGKGKAIAAGIRKARGKYLLFCDGDLINFTPLHIKRMLTPVISGKTHLVLAVPTKDKTGRYARTEVFLAGERVYPKKALLPHLAKLSRSKGAGGSEVYLNTLFKRRDIQIVPLIGLIKPPKEDKWSSTTALKQYLHSVIGVLQEAGRIEIHTIGDLKQLENLVQVDTFENLIVRIKEIRNKRMRSVLEGYYLKYVAKYLKKIRV